MRAYLNGMDLLGYNSVAMNSFGDIVIVGAPGNDGINGNVSGHARVYTINTSLEFHGQAKTLITFPILGITKPLTDETYVAKIDPNGNWEWVSKIAGAVNNEIVRGNDIAIDCCRNIYVTGETIDTDTVNYYDFDYSTNQPNLTASFTLTPTKQSSAFIAKIDNNSFWQNTPRFISSGSSGIIKGNGIYTDDCGHVYVAGSFTVDIAFANDVMNALGNSDVFVVKYNSDLSLEVWLFVAGGTLDDNISNIDPEPTYCKFPITVDDCNNVYIANATTSDPIIFGNLIPEPKKGIVDMYIAKINDDLCPIVNILQKNGCILFNGIVEVVDSSLILASPPIESGVKYYYDKNINKLQKRDDTKCDTCLPYYALGINMNRLYIEQDTCCPKRCCKCCKDKLKIFYDEIDILCGVKDLDDLPNGNWKWDGEKYTIQDFGKYELKLYHNSSIIMKLNKNSSFLHSGSFGLLASTLQLAPSDTISLSARKAPMEEEDKLLASDGAADDRFGRSVSISKDGVRIIIGSRDKGTGGFFVRGAAYIFKCTGTTWTQEQKIKADVADTILFGISVSINADGNRVVVGSEGDNSFKGSAYIFKRTGTTWTQEQKIVASDRANFDFFGISVSINSDGSRVIISATRDDNDIGSAYIFKRDGTIWTEEQKIIASDGASSDRFGTSVSINSDGSRVIIGAQEDDSNTGSAYIFKRNGTLWLEEQKILASDAATLDRFGNSVSINADGSRVIVGAFFDDNDNNKGSAYIFKRDETTWTEEQKIIASDRTVDDQFGSSVSINSNGCRVIVSAIGDDSNKGSAYIFNRIGITWTEEQKIIASDGASSDRFGTSVSINGDGLRTIVGALNDDDKGNNSGSAYVFGNKIDIITLLSFKS